MSRLNILVKLHTLLDNFDFPNGFVADLDTKQIYLAIERVGSKVCTPHFINKFSKPFNLQDTQSKEYISRMMKRFFNEDEEMYPILITRDPYHRFVSAFEVMFYQDRHIPEDLFNFKFQREHSYFFKNENIFDRRDTANCKNTFQRYTEFICNKPITYNFIKPITSYFLNLDVINEIECVDLVEFANTNQLRKKVEKRTDITVEEYFHNDALRHCFESKYSDDFEQFGYKHLY